MGTVSEIGTLALFNKDYLTKDLNTYITARTCRLCKNNTPLYITLVVSRMGNS